MEGVLIVSPLKMPSISLPPLVSRKIFGSGQRRTQQAERAGSGQCVGHRRAQQRGEPGCGAAAQILRGAVVAAADNVDRVGNGDGADSIGEQTPGLRHRGFSGVVQIFLQLVEWARHAESGERALRLAKYARQRNAYAAIAPEAILAAELRCRVSGGKPERIAQAAPRIGLRQAIEQRRLRPSGRR
jgi:hypothetical protein